MSLTSTDDPRGLVRRYSTALRNQLAQKTGVSCGPAKRLGREALAAGLDTLDLVRVHEQALLTLLSPGLSSRNSNGKIKRAARFFVAALTPIESAHRATVEHNGHLRRLNVTMRQHTVELAATRRMLKREIGRRMVMQRALKTSERHYGRLLDKSRLMQEHLRRLSHEILSTQEEERKRISRELHDQIGQTLTAVNVRLAALNKQSTVNTRQLRQHIATTQRLVERSMNTVHRFARDLRPALLDDLGLVAALKSHMRAFTTRTGIPIRFTAFAAIERLASEKRTVLYRVAQEALANVAKHAHASLVTVRLARLPGLVRMEIHDNGRSFQVERVLFAKRINRLGLLGMRERLEMVAGSFSVESAPGKGTTIRAQIPFGNGAPRAKNRRKRESSAIQ